MQIGVTVVPPPVIKLIRNNRIRKKKYKRSRLHYFDSCWADIYIYYIYIAIREYSDTNVHEIYEDKTEECTEIDGK